MIVEVRIVGADAVVRGLEAVKQILGSGSAATLGGTIAKEGLSIVTRLTPRKANPNVQRLPGSKRGFTSFASQWELIERVSGRGAYEGLIRNRATLTASGLVALASVEFGARPHTISPKSPDGRLVWYQGTAQKLFLGRSSAATRGGRDPGSNIIRDRYRRRRQDNGVVFARSVNHPGHAGFRMVEETKRILTQISQTAMQNFAAEIRQQFASAITVGVQ